jgi:hypothetical protein
MLREAHGEKSCSPHGERERERERERTKRKGERVRVPIFPKRAFLQ